MILSYLSPLWQEVKMFAISGSKIDSIKLRKSMENPKAGALVIFEGLVRNHNEGSSVSALEYECYTELAENEYQKIYDEARSKFKVYDITCVHRTGFLDITDMAVWVGVTSAHRDAAFQACRYIIDEVKDRLPIWKKEHYVSGKSEWVNCQGCAAHHKHHNHDHTHIHFSEKEYYSRQVNLPGFNQSGQDTLKNSSVLVIGAGGLGSPALTALASAGVGTIGICDSDRLEVSNLHRQTLYTYEDIGEYKARQAQKHLKKRNPFIEIIAHCEKFDGENCSRIVQGYDIILDCTDNFSAKYLIHDTAYLNKIPLVQSSIYQHEGHVQLFLHNDTSPCMRCTWPDQPEEGCVGNCAEAGVLGVVPAILGSYQANEALKHLLQWEGTLFNETLIVNLLSNDSFKIRRGKQELCPLCGSNPVIKDINPDRYIRQKKHWEISVKELEETKQEYYLIDIRPEEDRKEKFPWEQSIPHFPSGNIEKLLELDQTKQYLLVCVKGVRSRRVVQNLREKGYSNYFAFDGGMENLGSIDVLSNNVKASV